MLVLATDTRARLYLPIIVAGFFRLLFPKVLKVLLVRILVNDSEGSFGLKYQSYLEKTL